MLLSQAWSDTTTFPDEECRTMLRYLKHLKDKRRIDVTRRRTGKTNTSFIRR